MLRLRAESDRVLVAVDDVVALGRAESDFLKDRLFRDGLDRLRICCHRSTDDKLHEMFMVFTRDTYIRPSLHRGKDESLLVLEGLATNFFFDADGNVREQVSLGPPHSGRPFYCRVPADTYHCLLVESDYLLAKEATTGPFVRADTHFAPWAPDGNDPAAARAYTESLRQALRRAA
jgi:cupin fold WbuC family metalloprotein